MNLERLLNELGRILSEKYGAEITVSAKPQALQDERK